MVSKCANPACAAPFLYLHEGRIFVLRSAAENTTDVSDAVVERYWLCANCSAKVTLVLRAGEVTLEPLPRLEATGRKRELHIRAHRPAA